MKLLTFVHYVLAYLEAMELMPVNKGLSDGQVSAESFERGVRHGGVILVDSHLILCFRFLDELHHVVGSLTGGGDLHRILHFLVRQQLHVTILVIMHLGAHNSFNLGKSIKGSVC